jgi:mono/diheme cytochrome c family protein
MVSTLFSLLVLIALFILFAGLTRLAWRAQNGLVKFSGVVVAGLLTILLGTVSGFAIRGLYLSQMPRNFPVTVLVVQATPEQLERGEELANFLCSACHSVQGAPPLSGGKNLAEDIGLPLGDIYPPNLTPGGDLANWTDGEILRAIREGTGKNGKPLAMPVANLKNLSDEDVQAIIAYLRSQPPIQNPTPALRPTLLSLIMVGANLFDYRAEPVPGPVRAPRLGPSAEYGEYLVRISDCRDCHGPDLSGGKPPAPPGPNLRSVAFWTQEQFITAMRTGKTPGGYPMKPPMPWKQIGTLDDVELEALYEYLRALPPN